MKNKNLSQSIKNHPYIVIILLFFISRLSLVALWPIFNLLSNIFNYEQSVEVWSMGENFISYWLGFDSEHYLSIAENGYDARRTAFFPLYPLMIKLFSYTGIPIYMSGIILSNLFFLLSLIIFYKLLKSENEDTFYPILLILFSPITIYFMSVYTESLFLFFILTFFYFLSKNNYGLAAIIIGLASLTRNSGSVLFLIFFIDYFINKGWTLNKSIRDIIGVLIGIILFLTYPFYLFLNYGNATLYVKIQSVFWNRYFTLPWETIFLDIKNIIENPSAYLIAIFNILFIILVFWILFSKVRLKLTYLLFVLLSTFMPLMYPVILGNMPYTTSVNRYILVLFPIYIFISKRIKNNLVRIIVLEIMYGITIMFTTAFLYKQFIG